MSKFLIFLAVQARISLALIGFARGSAGYDLTHLFIGSEGTLGVITELTVKLHSVQQAISAATCHFPNINAAVETVIQAIKKGIPIARMELLDRLSMRAINLYSGYDYAEKPHLFLEFHGSPNSVKEQAEQVQGIAFKQGGHAFEWTLNDNERERLWVARHNAYPAALALKPGCKPVTTDVCVPISRLSECINASLDLTKTTDLPVILLGHVGDGNFHLLILPDATNPKEITEAETLNHQIVELALSMEGTCTGEHGIGMGKIDFLEQEHPTGIAVMKQLKNSLDPKGILNPGKLFRESR